MIVNGIIAEYNPFHNGHKYQLDQCREATNADYVIVSELRSGKDDVLHACAAQGLGALLAQYPAHRVADIAFSGAVGADDRRNAFIEDDLGPLGKRLESVQLQFL